MTDPKAVCASCGGELSRASSAHDSSGPAISAGCVLDDWAAALWVRAYDAAWLGRDWRVLEKCLAPDVTVMLEGFSRVIVGRPSVLAYMRKVMAGAEVHEYNATDLTGHPCGAIGVVTYRWQLDATVEHKRRATSGRAILVLSPVPQGWQLAWRAQITL